MQYPNTTMDGKVVLVTGATSGIGKATALALAGMGATTIVAGRDRTNTDATVRELQAASGNRRVEAILADLTAQADIRRLAAELRDRHDHLDVLVNNAGAGFAAHQESVDGVELTWALDYLSVFLLTNLLMESLQAADAGRVVNIGTASHRRATIHFEDPGLKGRYSANRAYGQAKLAVLMFTYELARRLGGSGVTANVADPGPVDSNLFRAPQMAGFAGRLTPFARFMHRAVSSTPEKGAETVVFLASSPEIASVTGKNWHKKRVTATSNASRSERDWRRLWELSERMTRSAPATSRPATTGFPAWTFR